jgi:restriction system protein
MDSKKNLPTARQMIPALTEALVSLGGQASVRDLEQAVATQLGLTSEQLSITHDKSRTEFQYRLAWTRSYAKKQGLVNSPVRNMWELNNA